MANKPKSEDKKPAEKPVSLRPLRFEEAVESLLRVKPEPGRLREPGGKPDNRMGQSGGDQG